MSADMIDAACEREEKDRELALQTARSSMTILPDTGACHNCGDPVKDGHFCDADCRDDWQKRNRQGAR
jgi:hypothetical protein